MGSKPLHDVPIGAARAGMIPRVVLRKSTPRPALSFVFVSIAQLFPSVIMKNMLDLFRCVPRPWVFLLIFWSCQHAAGQPAQEPVGPALPPNLADLERSLVDARGWNARPVRFYVVGDITSEMSLGQKVAQVYSRAYELDPTIDLRRLLVDRYPDRKIAIINVFSERLSSREPDKKIFDLVDQSDENSTASFLRSVIEEEASRSREFSSKLSELLTLDEKSRLVEHLVRRDRFASFNLPLVADAFNFKPSQVESFANIHRSVAVEIFKIHPMKVNVEGNRLAVASFLEQLKLMSTKQIRQYFHLVGQLKENEPISELTTIYPDGSGEQIVQLYDRKSEEELSSQ